MVLLKKSIEETTTESAIPLLEIAFFIVDHQGTPSPIPLYSLYVCALKVIWVFLRSRKLKALDFSRILLT